MNPSAAHALPLTPPGLADDLDPFSLIDEAEPTEGPLKVFIEQRRYKKNMTIVSGFSRSADLDALTKELKNAVAAGGTHDAGRIELQGDHRKRVVELLQKKGYRIAQG